MKQKDIDKEKFVRDIVQGILDKDDMDMTEITEIVIEDYGNCVHVVFKGGVFLSTIAAICQSFGDDNPNIYGAEGNAIKIVMLNENFNELYG